MNKQALKAFKELVVNIMIGKFEFENKNLIKIVEQALSRPTAEEVLAVVEERRNIEVEKFENHGASHNYHNVNLLNEIIAKIKEMLK